MIRKNIYSRITESIVNAYHDHNLDTAMDDGHEMENMGKKIVAIITADPDQDLDWESEYEPFGATELSDEDEKEAFEHEGMESDHDLCPSCGYDVDCEGDECEDESEADEYEDAAPVIGGGFDDEDDDYEDMDVKDILVDILHELKGEDSDSEDEGEGAFETSDENPMFGSSDESDDEEESDDDEEDYSSMLGDNESDWGSDEEDDSDEEDYDDEEDFEQPTDEDCLDGQEQEEDEVEIFDSLDNA
jgi:hypothetical protein